MNPGQAAYEHFTAHTERSGPAKAWPALSEGTRALWTNIATVSANAAAVPVMHRTNLAYLAALRGALPANDTARAVVACAEELAAAAVAVLQGSKLPPVRGIKNP